MTSVRIPGVIWVIGIVLILTLGRSYIEQQGLNPIYLDALVIVVIAVMKTLNLGTKEIEELLDVISILQRQVDKREAELSPDTLTVETMSMAVPTPKEYPINYFVRWLVG